MYPVANEPSKIRTWIIIFGVTILLIIIGFFAFVFIKKEPNTPVVKTITNLFPFKNKQPTNTSPDNQVVTPIEEPTSTEPIQPLPDIANTEKIRKITDFSISGYHSAVTYLSEKRNVYDEKLKKEVTIEEKIPLDELYFTKRENGFLYRGDVTPETIIQKQLTQTRVPGVYETIILTNPLRLVYRYAVGDTIQSFSAPVTENKKPVPVSSNALTYCSSDFSRDLKRGNKGNDVLTVQTLMNEKLGTQIKQDGVFGRETLATIKKLQEFLSVSATGIYDQTTRDALYKICETYKAEKLASENTSQAITEPKEITGKLLEKNIIDMTTDPTGTLFFSLIRNSDFFTRGIITDTGNKTRDIFNSPFSEWRPQWINNNLVVLTTKSSGSADGYAYGLNLTSGAMRKLIGPFSGLVTNTSPDNKKILYSENTSDSNTISLWVKTIGRDLSKRMTQDTLAEKCTWSNDSIMVYCMIPDNIPPGNYPDDWYMGATWFNDTLWQFNLVSGISTQIGIFPEEIDGYKLSVSSSGKYLYVVNRLNDNLWVVNLEK